MRVLGTALRSPANPGLRPGWGTGGKAPPPRSSCVLGTQSKACKIFCNKTISDMLCYDLPIGAYAPPPLKPGVA